MYTNDMNAQIVLALLKKYHIRKIVVSPGWTNIPIAGSVQVDPFFEVYSVVDERSAAYFATGLAFESGEPVVISCTGATASRNYLPALTEAYYRKLPIIALTSQNFGGNYSNFLPQLTDRTVSQNDVKRFSVHLPVVKDKNDEAYCSLSVNKALIAATKNGGGPVHINLLIGSAAFETAYLPDVPVIEYYTANDLLCEDCVSELRERLRGKKIAVLIGSHKKFLSQESEALERFIDAYNVAVFCDHTANYHGKNKLLISVAADLKRLKAQSDIVIDIGGVLGDYSAPSLFGDSVFWRVSEDGELNQRYGNLRVQFDCSEPVFFKTLAGTGESAENGYFTSVIEAIGGITIPELPFSNTFLASQTSARIPNGSSLHLGILNSLRNINYFSVNETIDCSCNVGGFGIDGAVSTIIGQSMANRNRLYFGHIGDLAFFYDMNALGIRHINRNIRLLLVNNGRGVEFRVNQALEDQLGDKIDEYIAAAGHYGSAKAWAESAGFIYMEASSKDEFLQKADDFYNPDIDHFDKPVLFQTFTTVECEQEGLRVLREANRSLLSNMEQKAKSAVRRVIPGKAQNVLRKILKKQKL